MVVLIDAKGINRVSLDSSEHHWILEPLHKEQVMQLLSKEFLSMVEDQITAVSISYALEGMDIPYGFPGAILPRPDDTFILAQVNGFNVRFWKVDFTGKGGEQ